MLPLVGLKYMASIPTELGLVTLLSVPLLLNIPVLSTNIGVRLFLLALLSNRNRSSSFRLCTNSGVGKCNSLQKLGMINSS